MGKRMIVHPLIFLIIVSLIIRKNFKINWNKKNKELLRNIK